MTRHVRRAILITLDGVGIGALPDADAYGDVGSNTLAHVAAACGGLHLPNLQSLGLGNLLGIAGVPPTARSRGGFGRMLERSAGKDSTTGHWELAGVIQNEPLPTFPRGFPDEILAAFRRETGLDPLGNCAASGTEILRQLGEEHLRSGRPIVYTSADSVFQIAAHEAVMPVARLYAICRIARRILDPYRIGRVIARPFVGEDAASFKRTARRHDFSLPPTGETVLDRLCASGFQVLAVGKIDDIFTGRGITGHQASAGNVDGMAKTLAALEQLEQGLVFTNLIDFDMLYGHRLDAAGFGSALEVFDAWLPRLMAQLQREDLLLLTADHGCDPTTPGTDHTREAVPILAWSPAMSDGVDLGTRASFADVAATLDAFFGTVPGAGKSFFGALQGGGGGD